MSTRSVAPALFMFAVCHLRGGRSWKTWVDSDLFLLLSDSLFHMETLMEKRQFQFTENGLSVNTLIADERSPLLDGMERRVSSTVSLRCTANSKRESVVLNLSIITFARLNRWGSVDCLFEAWSTSNHFAAFIIATRTTFWRYFLFPRIVRFPLLFSQDISYHKQS